MDNIEIGKRIFASRNAKKMTQDELARLMNVTRGAVGSWEHGRSLPPAKNFLKLASILGVSVAYLQLQTDEPCEEKEDMPKSEINLLYYFRKLNKDGQDAVLSVIESFVCNPSYTKKEATSAS